MYDCIIMHELALPYPIEGILLNMSYVALAKLCRKSVLYTVTRDPQGTVHIRLLNPPLPLNRDGVWSCLDAGSREAETTHCFWWCTPTQLPVTANDATHGYKWQVVTLASYFHPEEGQSIWSKCRHGSNPVFKAGIKLPYSFAKLRGNLPPLTPNQNTPLYSLQLLFIHPTIVRCLNYIILVTKFSTNFKTLTDTHTLI